MNTATNLIDDLRILEQPRPWQFYAAWLLAGMAVAGLVFWWLKYRARRLEHRQTVLPVDAHEDALAALEKARALLARATCRPYAIAVSGIVRRYLENRFGLLAPRQSTEEFLEQAQQSPKLSPSYQGLLAEFLKNCDFLKFARGLAEVPELETLHASAVRFVSETKVAPTPSEAIKRP